MSALETPHDAHGHHGGNGTGFPAAPPEFACEAPDAKINKTHAIQVVSSATIK